MITNFNVGAINHDYLCMTKLIMDNHINQWIFLINLHNTTANMTDYIKNRFTYSKDKHFYANHNVFFP